MPCTNDVIQKQMKRRRTINQTYITGPQGSKRFNYTKDILLEQRKKMELELSSKKKKTKFKVPEP